MERVGNLCAQIDSSENMARFHRREAAEWRARAAAIGTLLEMPRVFAARLQEKRRKHQWHIAQHRQNGWPELPETRESLREFERRDRSLYASAMPKAMRRALVRSRQQLEQIAKGMDARATWFENLATKNERGTQWGRRTSGRSGFERDRDAWRAHGHARGVLLMARLALNGGTAEAPEALAERFTFADGDTRAWFLVGIRRLLSKRRTVETHARAILNWLLIEECLPDSVAPLVDYDGLTRLIQRIDAATCCMACRHAYDETLSRVDRLQPPDAT